MLTDDLDHCPLSVNPRIDYRMPLAYVFDSYRDADRHAQNRFRLPRERRREARTEMEEKRIEEKYKSAAAAMAPPSWEHATAASAPPSDEQGQPATDFYPGVPRSILSTRLNQLENIEKKRRTQRQERERLPRRRRAGESKQPPMTPSPSRTDDYRYDTDLSEDDVPEYTDEEFMRSKRGESIPNFGTTKKRVRFESAGSFFVASTAWNKPRVLSARRPLRTQFKVASLPHASLPQ